jgi:hypothetical protein
MSFNYKDLTYIRVALESYEASLLAIEEDECDGDEFSDIQDDILYVSRLLALTNNDIKEWEESGPGLNPVKDH